MRTHTLIVKTRAVGSSRCGLAFVVILRVGVGNVGDISYDKATPKSEGKVFTHSLTFLSLVSDTFVFV